MTARSALTTSAPFLPHTLHSTIVPISYATSALFDLMRASRNDGHVSVTKCVCMSQVYAMPVYDMIEYQIVSLSRGKIPNGFFTRLIYRSIYIVLVAFIGMTLPFFGGKPYPSLPCPTLLCPALPYFSLLLHNSHCLAMSLLNLSLAHLVMQSCSSFVHEELIVSMITAWSAVMLAADLACIGERSIMQCPSCISKHSL